MFNISYTLRHFSFLSLRVVFKLGLGLHLQWINISTSYLG